MTSLIYVVGRGHSGTTLLDTLLDRHSQVSCTGELKWLSRRKRAQVDRLFQPCACGASPMADCEFWRAVDRNLRSLHGFSLNDLDVESDDMDTFAKHNLALFSTVGQLTGCSHVVDSSKGVRRLEKLLSLADRLKIYPVYMIRDPRAVVYSHIRRGRDLKYWAQKYASSSRAIHDLLDSRVFQLLEYEALASDPAASLSGLMGGFGLEMEPKQLAPSVHAHHQIAGNVIPLGQDANIRLDDRWRRGLSRLQQWQITWHTRVERKQALALRACQAPPGNQVGGDR